MSAWLDLGLLVLWMFLSGVFAGGETGLYSLSRTRLEAGVPGMAPQTTGRLRGDLQGVMRAMNGGGVRPGTIHPPTESQRERVAAVRAAVGRMD